MRISEVFTMGGGCGHGCGHDCSYSCYGGYGGYSKYYNGYYPDYGRWSYHYYDGCGYGYTRSRGLLGILG
ncbi:MAG: hypothetical protein JO281_08530 [Pseudonocardiales bacterium]|nr:hypothetical protein [Pseudonocardiales bacterium]